MKNLIVALILFATSAAAQEIPPGLETHYLCNALIEYGYQMSNAEKFSCSQNYVWLKASFMTVEAEEWGNTDTEGRAEIMLQAYRDFKSWEEENFELVESLRIAQSEIARTIVGQ